MPVASLTPASFQLTPHGANPWNVGKAKRSIATYSDRTRIKLNVVENQNDTYRYNVEDYSWQKYNTNEKQYVKQFKKYGIIYKTSVLTDEEFNTVKTELSNLSLDVIQETTSSVAHNRMGAQLPSDCEIIKMLSSTEGSFTKLINEIAGDCNYDRKMELSRIVPVEMRTYEQRGAGMEWHYDDVLYEPEQVEVVLTVENNSDCVTSWEEVQSNSEEIKLKQIETQPNSAIILKAGPSGARHSVSALKNGKRVILKFVFIRENAKFLEGAENHAKQFVSKKKNGPRKKKRKR
jgi:hypothetical protein